MRIVLRKAKGKMKKKEKEEREGKRWRERERRWRMSERGRKVLGGQRKAAVCHVIYFYSLAGDTCKADASGIK